MTRCHRRAAPRPTTDRNNSFSLLINNLTYVHVYLDIDFLIISYYWPVVAQEHMCATRLIVGSIPTQDNEI